MCQQFDLVLNVAYILIIHVFQVETSALLYLLDQICCFLDVYLGGGVEGLELFVEGTLLTSWHVFQVVYFFEGRWTFCL